jgi:hypothetical protein
LKTWLEMVARRKVRVVLIDTIDKTQKKPLLDLPGEKRGFMSLGQLMEVDKMARNLGIKVLWAGGITLPQVFELGRAGVFGIYVTSAASAQIPVTPEYEPDPSLPAVKEPTFEGVFRTKLLLEAGFVGGLPSKASGTNPIEKAAKRLLDQIRTGDKAVRRTEKELADLTEDAWRGIRAKMKKQ